MGRTAFGADYKYGSWEQTEKSWFLVWVTIPIARDGCLSLMQQSS